MTNQQEAPEALRLADEAWNFDCSEYRGVRSANAAMMGKLQDCADMIRKLHTENTMLQAGYAAARLEIESLQARIKTMAEEHADELMVAHMDGMRAAQAAPAAGAGTGSGEVVAHRVVRKSLSGDEWASDARDWSDGPPSRALVDSIRADGRWRIDVAYAAPTPQPAPQQEALEPVAWYVTGCSRLLDEDEAKAEARHIGGTARAIPLYTAPQADSVQDLQPVHDAVTIDLLNERVAYLERKLKEADSVLEDAVLLKEARDALWQPANVALCERIDAYLEAARKQGANHD